MKLETDSIPGLDSISLNKPGCSEHYITAHPAGFRTSFDMFEAVANQVREKNASILGQYVFGGCQHHTGGMRALEQACGSVEWPVTWLQGDSCSGEHLTGTQVYAVSGATVERVHLDGRVVGATFEDNGVKQCMLGNLLSTNNAGSRQEQAQEAFEKMEEILLQVGMGLSNVVRTWIYLEDLLEWYDEFNDVRTTFFQERGVFDGMVPASTGIGALNHAGHAAVIGVLAMQPADHDVKMQAVPSPRQCPAIDYSSSFSRAALVSMQDHKRLYISGTASIEPEGETAHVGSTERQIDLTMEVVKSILEANAMSWSDTTRGIAYFKDAREISLLEAYCKKKELPHLPLAVTHADVCRDDLLFELELDAMVVDGT